MLRSRPVASVTFSTITASASNVSRRHTNPLTLPPLAANLSYIMAHSRKSPPKSPRRLRWRMVSGRSCIGGILPMVYLLPSRPADPKNPKLFKKLPRDLFRTIGEPLPRIAFARGALPPPVKIWRVRESSPR
jgi:hypothetical protein